MRCLAIRPTTYLSCCCGKIRQSKKGKKRLTTGASLSHLYLTLWKVSSQRALLIKALKSTLLMTLKASLHCREGSKNHSPATPPALKSYKKRTLQITGVVTTPLPYHNKIYSLSNSLRLFFKRHPRQSRGVTNSITITHELYLVHE